MPRSIFIGSRPRKGLKSRRESGFSAVELMLFTVPLCVLSMMLASRLAATSQAKGRAQWQAALAAQQDAVRLCSGTPTLNAPWHSSPSNQKIHAIHGLSVPPVVDSATAAGATLVTYTGTGDVARVLSHITSVGNIVSEISMGMHQLASLIEQTGPFPTDLLQQQRLTDTSWSVQTVSVPLGSFYFKPLSTRLLPSGAVQLSAGAAVICHEADGSPSPLNDIQTQLLVWAFDEANRFYY